MSTQQLLLPRSGAIPVSVHTVFRGIGQVFFQENSLTGVIFVLGIAVSSLPMALAAVVGSAIGAVTARLLKFDEAEVAAGIYGFNAALVGIASLFFFQAGAVCFLLLAAGCVAATLLTHQMRRHLPFPTYTTPFIVTTWVLFLVGQAAGIPRVEPGEAPDAGYVEAALHGVSQVMFQAHAATGVFFLMGIAMNDGRHASWVLLAAIAGTLVGGYHATAASRAIDVERLVDRALVENIALGLYGYNATLAAIALYLWRKSLIPPALGILLAVLLTELVPLIGLPALTAPFVLATWLVLAFGWLDGKFFGERASSVEQRS